METWKPIPRNPTYEVSDLGNVRSIERIIKSKRWSCGTQKRSGGMLAPIAHNRGYVTVQLRQPDRRVFVHVVVLEAFVGPRPAGYDACHKDGDRINNKLSNLYWGTRSQNVADAKRHGTSFTPGGLFTGEKHPMAKLTESDIRKIRELREAGAKLRMLAVRFSVAEGTISAICRRHIWKSIA